MKKAFHFPVIMTLLIFSLFPLRAQSQTDSLSHAQYRLTLADGSVVVGTIITESTGFVFFKTLSGIQMTIPEDQITKREITGGEFTGEGFYTHDPNSTRLFFAPTARSLKGGSGYFSAYEIFFPMLAFGVGDFLSLAGGMTLFPGVEEQLFYLAPKITPLHLKDFDLATGFMYLNTTGGSEEGVGILYGVGTYGSELASFTGGMGWGLLEGELNNKPVFLAGGELRLSSSYKLISENWIPSESDLVLLSLGIRFFGEHLAADFAFIYPAGSEIEGFPFIPWAGFVYNFGSN